MRRKPLDFTLIIICLSALGAAELTKTLIEAVPYYALAAWDALRSLAQSIF